jgi:DNA-binding NarL/FixJ family response regulator
MKLRIMLADDHAVYRDALCMWLELAPDMEVVAQAHDGYSLLQGVAQSRPDVVCMDLNMPGLDGIESTRQLLQLQPTAKVIGLSASIDLLRVAEMFRVGALAYVLKGSDGGELLAAIRSVSQNRHYLDSALGVKDVAELLRPSLSRHADTPSSALD